MPFDFEDVSSNPDPQSFYYALTQAYSSSEGNKKWRRKDLRKLWTNFLQLEDNDMKKHEFCVILVNITIEVKEARKSEVYSKGIDNFINEVYAKLDEHFEELFVKDTNAGNIKDDPTLLFALNGLGSLNAMLQNIDKAFQYFKMVIDCVNGFILNGETSIINSSFCDIYSEYVILHDMHKLDLKKAKKDVNAFFDTINKHSSKNMSKSELIYILVSKTNAMWIFQNYQECIGTMEKVLKVLRKNREQQGNVETPVLQLQLLYQIAKVHEKMGNTEYAFETYSKIVNCEESESNLMYMAGSYYALGKIHYERDQSAKSREFFVKLFRCAEKMNDYNQMMAIPLFTQQPESVGEMITECLPILLMTGGLPSEINTIANRNLENKGKDALKHKESGNKEFKAKKYRRAITEYTIGLDIKCEDDLLNVQLLTNRAAAHFHLENFRGSLNDCKEALDIKKDHLKALKRGTFCLFKLKKTEECIQWAKKALKIDGNDAEMLEILRKCEKNQK